MNLRDQLLYIAYFHRRKFFSQWNQLLLSDEKLELELEEKIRFLLSHWEGFRKLQLPTGIRFISIFDFDYPESLKQLPQPPLGLFVRGQLPEGCAAMSVVGSRKPQAVTLRNLRSCVKSLALQGVCIVSGGAMGVDTEAHQTALDFETPTLAVLGGGIQKLHPRRNLRLFEEIQKTGALISEYPPHLEPRPYFFPERNRLIAALGDALLLGQAHEKSGSLSTARTALELGKEIFVLRPPQGDENFAGSQSLIDSGAMPISSAAEILNHDW